MGLYLGDNKKLKFNISGGLFRPVAQSIFTLRGYVPFSSILAESETPDNHLFNLTKAINDGKKILIDMDVALSGDPVSIEKDIYIAADKKNTFTITAQTDKSSLIISSSVKNVCIENLDIIGSGVNYDFFYNDCDINGSLKMDNFIVRNCRFRKIRLYSQSDRGLYRGVEISYIKNFEFVGNTVQTVLQTFCNLADIMFDLVQIKNNRVNNFHFILFNFGTSNLLENATDEQAAAYQTLHDGKFDMIVDSNRVVNTFDWIQTDKSTLYHTFVLSECASFIYTNNYVEGLKASVDIATYDFYASCAKVLSEGNIWKNNICFADDHDNCTLMKAKNGGGTKIFRNNKYIIEQKYVDKLIDVYGATDTGLWVDIISITDDAEWEVYNNTIDLAVRLIFFGSSNPVKKINIYNNNITAKGYDGAFTARTPYYEAYWTFQNNIITSTSNTYKAIWLMTTAAALTGKTIIRNNIFNIPNHGIYGKMITDIGTDGSYIVDGNEFNVSACRNMSMADFTNNTIIGYNYSESSLAFNTMCNIVDVRSDGSIIPEQKMQFSLVTSNYGLSSTPILLYIPEDRRVAGSIKLIHTVDNVATECHVEFSTTSDGSLTIMDITDENNKLEVYQGLLRPESKVSKYFCSGLFRVVLYALGNTGAPYITVSGNAGVFDVDFECYQYEFEKV